MTGKIQFAEWAPLLSAVPLFKNIPASQLSALLDTLCPCVQQYSEGSLILLTGEENNAIRIVLQGEIHAGKISPGGSCVTMAHMGPGGVFGDVLSGSSTPSPVTVTALTPCTVMALPYERIIAPDCGDAAHAALLRNLVGIISDKYFSMCRRVDMLILKSLRAKLCAWLLEQSRQASTLEFTTFLTRAQLAEYLNCERSALSRELGRMQTEGLLLVHGRRFQLLAPDIIQKQYEGEVFS